ncbi:NUDIX domain-containing protein [Lichenibacterium dinghuense]|uniref:NUDIX domain-containing protein n=1 Tax=Lichenibacterium dinghuense TaxID=2895977 RepID=UPI001F1905DB|nr:NUDIX hydrolase [Lichenibacterium sp. 6Y81]
MSRAKPNVLVDVVSDRNVTIGGDYRHNLLREGKNFRTVHVIVIDRSGRLVLQMLPSDHTRSPNKIGSSVAGYLLSGESYIQAARRKMLEELGIYSNLHEIGDIDMLDEKSHKFVKVFTCRYNDKIESFDQDEIAKLVYKTRSWLSANTNRFPEKFTTTFLRVFSLYQSNA